MSSSLRDKLVILVSEKRWKAWGRLRKYGCAWYKCYRRGNKYLWVGSRHIMRSDSGIAVDFVMDFKQAKEFLK